MRIGQIQIDTHPERTHNSKVNRRRQLSAVMTTEGGSL